MCGFLHDLWKDGWIRPLCGFLWSVWAEKAIVTLIALLGTALLGTTIHRAALSADRVLSMAYLPCLFLASLLTVEPINTTEWTWTVPMLAAVPHQAVL